MLESILLSKILHFMLIVTIGFLAVLVIRGRKQQTLCNDQTDRKVNGILAEVQYTNGRLVALEEWRKAITDQVDEIHEYAQFMRNQVEGLLGKVVKEEEKILEEMKEEVKEAIKKEIKNK